MNPYEFEVLFEPNFNTPEVHDGYLVIDNFYKNFEDIHEMAINSSCPNWKNSRDSKNFKDYYDCRPQLWDPYPNEDYRERRYRYISSMLGEHFGFRSSVSFEPMVGNMFKLIKKIPKGHQFIPHMDESINMIVTIDKVRDGGTAFYKHSRMGEVGHEEQLDAFPLLDEDNLPLHIVPSVPNRCVIFKGSIPHGGYIEEPKRYYNDWRMNYVQFLEGE